MNSQTTLPLFDGDHMAPPLSLVEVLAQSKPATRAQQAFQRLVGKIEGRRDELARWQAFGVRYRQRWAAEVLPLQERLRAGQRQMALLIDELLGPSAPGRRLGKMQRAKLRQLLLNLLDGLRDEGDDAELEALNAKHRGASPVTAQPSEIAVVQAMLEGILGVDLGDDHGATSAEALMAHAQAKLDARDEAQQRQVGGDQVDPAGARPTARSSKAASAKARREQAAQEASQSIRDVYRKLASALHPDRETDAGERERKTTLMQRVNDAYASKDLLSLLGLQLEIEQIDAEHLAAVSPQRLAHFTQVLREQLAELESELAHCTLPFRIDSDQWGRSLTPEFMDKQLNADIATLQTTIREIDADLVAFRDPVRLRAELEQYPLESARDDELAPGDLIGLLDAFAAQMAPPQGRPKRRRGPQ